MSDEQITPKPWNAKPWGEGYVIIERDGLEVCRVQEGALYIHESGQRTQKANADLLSAAPELLEAVEAMLEDYETGKEIPAYEVREMCRRAKFKAYGEKY